MKSLYTIAGRVLCIEADDEQSFRWASGFIESLQFEPLDLKAVSAADYTLRLRRGNVGMNSRPPNLQSFAIMRGRCWMDESGGCYFEVDDSSILIDKDRRGVAEVRFGDSPLAAHPTAVVNVLTYAVFVLLRRMSLFDLHAAAVVKPEGAMAGALIIGASGSGKSSLTVRLASSGWRYLSDDMVVLCDGASGVQAHGLRRIFTVTQTTFAACELPFTDQPKGSFWAVDRDKLRLAPEAVFPQRHLPSCVPRSLFFPKIVDSAISSIEKLPQSEAMKLLVKCCPWSGYDRAVAPEYLRTLAHLARQTNAYELRAGRDLLNDPESAASLFAAYV